MQTSLDTVVTQVWFPFLEQCATGIQRKGERPDCWGEGHSQGVTQTDGGGERVGQKTQRPQILRKFGLGV